MSAIINFDATQVAPDTGAQDALPAGWYDVLIEASEMKPTKNGDGAYLEVKFNVIAPAQFANKKVCGRLNLRNPNATAQEIGYKQLSAICHATGILQVADSAQLHNIPLKIKLKLRKPDADYDASNDITAYKNINEQVQLASAVTGNGFPGQAAAQSFAAPPAFAVPPAQFAPPAFAQAPMQQPVQQAPQFAQAPQQAPQQAWQPPAAPQPWQAPQQPVQQAPQMQQAAPQPAWTPPVQQAPAPQQAAQQPMQQPVQQMQQPAMQQAPNPAVQAQAAVPPWMQSQQPAAA